MSRLQLTVILASAIPAILAITGMVASPPATARDAEPQRQVHEVSRENLPRGDSRDYSRDQTYRQFPGAPTDSRTLKVQERVERVYSAGEYDRALLIYEKELAPMGDKYAQYMTGYMRLHGKGAEADPAEALAWYRLAAERGERPFIESRDTLRESLDAEQRARADVLYSELWQRYGDRRLILDLIRSDLAVLKRQEEASDGISIAAGYSGLQSGDRNQRRVRARLLDRVQYLDSTGDAAANGVGDASYVRTLEEELRQELASIGIAMNGKRPLRRR